MSVSKKAKDKEAEISKKVIPNSGYDLGRRVSDHDHDLPRDLLREGDPQALLTTLAMLGIILKPREFQYAALCRRSPDLADRLYDRDMVFPQRSATCPVCLSSEDFDDDLAQKISPHLRDRSAFQPHIGRRVIKITMIKRASQTPTRIDVVVESNDVMNKLGEAYSAYRNAVRDLPRQLDLAVQEHFGYYQQNFFGDLLDQAMTKTASISKLTPGRELTTGYLCGAFRDTVCSESWVAALVLPQHSPAASLLGS